MRETLELSEKNIQIIIHENQTQNNNRHLLFFDRERLSV